MEGFMTEYRTEWIDPNTKQKLIFAIEDDPEGILEPEEQEVWEDIFPDSHPLP